MVDGTLVLHEPGHGQALADITFKCCCIDPICELKQYGLSVNRKIVRQVRRFAQRSTTRWIEKLPRLGGISADDKFPVEFRIIFKIHMKQDVAPARSPNGFRARCAFFDHDLRCRNAGVYPEIILQIISFTDVILHNGDAHRLASRNRFNPHG